MASLCVRRRWCWGWMGLAALLIGTALYYYGGVGRDRGAKSAPPSAVVVRGDIENLVSATGTIRPREYVDVGAQVSGQLRRIHVQVGDYVKEGDLLAEIDVTVYKAKVDASRAQLKYQKAQKIDKEAQLVLAELNYRRQKGLYESDATSLESYQSAEATWKSSLAQLEMIKAQIEQLESTLRADEANLNYTQIYAPMTGTIVSITARQGQTLNTNQQAPTILRIADLSVMTIKAQVSEADVNRLRKGMGVYFTTLGSDKRWMSQLDKVEPTPTTTNNVVLYNALFDVENSEGRLMSDMTTQVFFVVSSAKDVLLVPMGALELQRGKKAKQGIVRVVTLEGAIEERMVEVGVTSRLQAEILSGVKEGERVMVVGVKPVGGGSAKERQGGGVPPPRMF